MQSLTDIEYFEYCARDQLARAKASKDAATAQIHNELAECYQRLAKLHLRKRKPH
jgi:hypothetical protein